MMNFDIVVPGSTVSKFCSLKGLHEITKRCTFFFCQKERHSCPWAVSGIAAYPHSVKVAELPSDSSWVNLRELISTVVICGLVNWLNQFARLHCNFYSSVPSLMWLLLTERHGVSVISGQTSLVDDGSFSFSTSYADVTMKDVTGLWFVNCT